MKQQTFQSTLVLLGLLLGLVACTKNSIEEPAPAQPPQQELPNPLPLNALVKQLKRTEIDHETFTYNAKGQVVQVRSQWQYDQSDPTKISTIEYDFQYDAQDRPVQVTYTGGFKALYFYHGNLIERTKELLPGGAVAREVTYIYANNRISHEIWRVANAPGEPVTLYKHAFSYDAKGNLTAVNIYEQDENLQYKLLETIEYSDFDNKINPTSWLLRFPYLPQLRLQFNNPRKEVRRVAEGQPQTTTHAYEYNAQGLPVRKRSTNPKGFVSELQILY